MYVDKVALTDIKAIEHFEMSLAGKPGWHVIIGDNGAGKSTIVRSIALALIGQREAYAIRLNPKDWLRRGSSRGTISLQLLPANGDVVVSDPSMSTGHIPVELVLEPSGHTVELTETADGGGTAGSWRRSSICFSASYGPFRRFSGGSKEWEHVADSLPLAGAHLSIFGESVALTESLEWLQRLQYQTLEQQQPASEVLRGLMMLVNNSGLLPHGAVLSEVNSTGVFFSDGHGNPVEVTQLSDGFRSILSMTFDVIRHLVRIYGASDLFRRVHEDMPVIDVPGIVIIDEVDAHLHPAWQTRIGKWFTKVFPAMQFIVTSHSPLVCRASSGGSIWRLAAPGTGAVSGEVTGQDKERLIYGNILDAYGTELFGEEMERSKEGADRMKRLATLNTLSVRKRLSQEENEELLHLKSIFPSESESSHLGGNKHGQ